MVEKAKYEVVSHLGKVEIRRYPTLVTARAEGEEAFDLLFRFISGKNKQKAKVAMTAPVVSERIAMTAPVLSDEGSLAFVMPEGYSTETTPEPLDERVKVAEVSLGSYSINLPNLTTYNVTLHYIVGPFSSGEVDAGTFALCSLSDHVTRNFSD